MNIDEFVESLEKNDKPKDLKVETEALWIERNGNWQEAHQMVQSLDTREAFWVHAYLHRREGDIGNAQYWYKRAEKELPDISPDNEWKEIARALLE